MRIGEYVGNYRLVRLLAQGGMGAVYEGRNDQLDRRVAIKILHPNLATDREQRSRFLNEARVVNLINHPNLITIFEYGTLPNGPSYIVMEFLDGQTLAQRLREQGGQPSTRLALRVVRQVAAALVTAHEKGIIHRDLKPENLMLVPDSEVSGGERVKILDFGIAKIIEQQPTLASLTRAGIGMGTPAYMAPEQIYGASSVDGHADVYSLGVILYEMLCGERPFQCESPEKEMYSHLTHLPEPLRERAPGTPPVLAELVHQMLAKRSEDRPSMREILERLSAVEFSTASLMVVGQVAPRPSVLQAMGGVALGIGMFLGVVLFVGHESTRERTSRNASAAGLLSKMGTMGAMGTVGALGAATTGLLPTAPIPETVKQELPDAGAQDLSQHSRIQDRPEMGLHSPLPLEPPPVAAPKEAPPPVAVPKEVPRVRSVRLTPKGLLNEDEIYQLP